MFFTRNGRFLDIGILIVRLGVGFFFVNRGWSKMSGGVERWERLGGAMADLGITFAPVFWGFMASFAEFAGGICLMLGLAFPVFCFLLFFTMFVASVGHLVDGDGITGSAHSMEAGFTFAGLFFTGPGKYSLDHWLAERLNKSRK